MKKNLISIIVISTLLVLSALIWGFFQNSAKKSKAQTIENQILQIEMMEHHEDSLQIEIKTAYQKYYQAVDESKLRDLAINETKLQISRNEETIESIKRNLVNLRESSSTEIDSLTNELELSLNVQQDLLVSIQELEAEKNALIEKVNEANMKISDLNRTVETVMANLAKTQFKGTSFRVDIRKRNEKVTAKAKKARDIVVNFNLFNVPERYQGTHQFYLVITDEKSTPISVKTAIKITIEPIGHKVELLAQQVKEMDIIKEQQVAFVYELEDKLEPGVYTASVYSDIGQLGAVRFNLRDSGVL